MDCNEVRENLVAFVDGGLPPEKVKEMERHLAECPDCEREHRKVARFTTSLVELLEPLRPSRSFKESVLTTVTTHERGGLGLGPPPPRGRGPIEKWLLAIAVGLVVMSVIGAAALLFRSGPPAGKLVVEEGTATVLRYRRGSWQAAPERKEVYPGERVATSAGSRAVLRLEGASVTVGGEVTVQLESTPEALRIHFASAGELYVDVNILREFQVVAQNVRVTLGRGAANVALGADGRVTVSAWEGSPRVETPDVKIQLAEGRELTVPQGGRLRSEPEPIPEDRLKWLGREAGASAEDGDDAGEAAAGPAAPGD